MPRRASALLASAEDATCMWVAAGATPCAPMSTPPAGRRVLRITESSTTPSYPAWTGKVTPQNTSALAHKNSTVARQTGVCNTALAARTVAPTQTPTTVLPTNKGSTALEAFFSGATAGTDYGQDGTRLSGWTSLPARHSAATAIK